MKILMVYPDYENTFWGFKGILKFIGKKAAYPPLGLITIGGMLPLHWEKKLIDMNTDKLEEKEGYFRCKWCGATWTNTMGLSDEYNSLCMGNSLIKRILLRGFIKGKNKNKN